MSATRVQVDGCCW